MQDPSIAEHTHNIKKYFIDKLVIYE